MGAPRTTLGASEVAAIFGFSPWVSPFALWARLHGLTEKEEENAETLRGHILEPAIREWYGKKLGVKLRKGPEYGETPWSREDAPWQAARPDSYWWQSEENPINLLEIKTARDWHDWADGVPVYYKMQVLWQQWVCAGTLYGPPAETHVVCYSPMNDEIREYILTYDEQAQRRAAQLSKLATEWWDRHIVGGEPVVIDAHASTREAIRQMYARPTKEYLQPTPELASLVADYRAAQAAHKATETPYELARNRLVAAIGNTSGIDGLCTLTAGKARRLILKGE